MGRTALAYDELLRRVGHMRQLAGVETCTSWEGRLVYAYASPVHMWILPDRALDVGALWYKGLPLAWISPTGFRPQGGVRREWLDAFGGGFLSTCGLENVGAACEDEGVAYPQHGSLGSIAAEHVCTEAEWNGPTYEVRVKGRIRQAKVFGDNLVVHRRYVLRLFTGELTLEDTVVNEGYAEAPFLLLYHINLGYPLVDEATVFHFPPGPVEPRDEAAQVGLSQTEKGSAPIAGMREQVFRRRPAPGNVEVRVENPALGIGFRLGYASTQLPQLWQWRMLGEGTYVVGIEPANATVRGRRAQRLEEGLPILQPGEQRHFRLDFRFYDLAPAP